MRLAVALLLGGLAGCGGSGAASEPAPAPTPAPTPSTQVLVERDLTFCTVAGQPLKADWVAPPDAVAKHRVLLFVHGGGWSTGSRADYEPLARGLAAQGYAGLLVDYRLAPSVRHPEAVQDLNCALRWLRQQAAARGVDAEHVGVIGGSAGAHLAGWVAYGGDDPALVGAGQPQGPRARVTLAVLHGGPHDFSVLDSLGPDQRGAVYALLGTPTPSPAQLVAASTVTRVPLGAVPTLILHGEADPLVPPDQARRLDAALSRVGAPHRLDFIPGAGHSDFGSNPDAVGSELLSVLATYL